MLFLIGVLVGESLSAPWRALRDHFCAPSRIRILRHGAALEAQGRWGDAADAYRRGIECDMIAEPLYLGH